MIGNAAASWSWCARVCARLGAAGASAQRAEISGLIELRAHPHVCLTRKLEALTNVARHSGSHTARLVLRRDEGRVSLEVIEDGRGLAGAQPGTGVVGMRERANLVGGSLSIADGRDRGTVVHLTLSSVQPLMTSSLKIGILLADDHALVRRGLWMVLDSQPDLEVVDEVGDGAQAVERAVQADVDLAILDVTMPRMTGLAATRELTRRRPGLRVLILSMHETNSSYTRR